MSYDLHLLPDTAGEDPLDVLERLGEDESPPTAEQAARLQRLGAALQAAIPSLEDNAGEAATAGEIHLMDPDGLEVEAYAHSGAVAFPYWDSLDVGRLVRDLERVATVFEEHLGWRMYDPQQEVWLDPVRDGDALRDAFDHGRAIVRDLAAEDSAPAPPPWWRRLGRRSS